MADPVSVTIDQMVKETESELGSHEVTYPTMVTSGMMTTARCAELLVIEKARLLVLRSIKAKRPDYTVEVKR